jgi:hypothetical protein
MRFAPERVYDEMWTGEWWWNLQVRILQDSECFNPKLTLITEIIAGRCNYSAHYPGI